MLRPAFKLILVATQISCAALASAQNTERPSDKCLRALNDIQAWHNHALSCGFDRATVSYAGSPVEQARCLLRRVQPGGRPVAQPTALPAYLEGLVGTPVALTSRQLSMHLRAEGIAAADIGGDLSAPVSRTSGNLPALYFVIHDTSSPEYDTDPFGPEIDRPDSRVNRLARHRAGDELGRTSLHKQAGRVDDGAALSSPLASDPDGTMCRRSDEPRPLPPPRDYPASQDERPAPSKRRAAPSRHHAGAARPPCADLCGSERPRRTMADPRLPCDDRRGAAGRT